jgi:hypothetical protein
MKKPADVIDELTDELPTDTTDVLAMMLAPILNLVDMARLAAAVFPVNVVFNELTVGNPPRVLPSCTVIARVSVLIVISPFAPAKALVAAVLPLLN